MLLERNIQLQQRQSQQISTQAIQSLSILQFSHAELSDYLKDQAERNPLLEVTMPDLTEAAPVSAGTKTATDRSVDGSAGSRSAISPGGQTGHAAQSDRLDLIEATCSSRVSLREHLLQQASLTFRDNEDQQMAAQLIEHIDEDGYLRMKLPVIASLQGVLEADLECVLGKIHGFEPAGVGARDLAECLRLQLADRDRLSGAMERLLQNLDLLARFETAKLARRVGVSPEVIIDMAREIRTLDPKPGRRFDTDHTLPALPDVVVCSEGDGSLRVDLNSDLLPRVLVDRQYYATVSGWTQSDDDRRFVVDCLSNANWLVRNLDQRAQTVLKVATEIAKRQEQFLQHGVEHLRPLVLNDVASAVGVHASTVSRAIAHKHMMTAHGMFELKFFFSNSITATDGCEEQSSETVRQKIRQLIEKETTKTVLSDDAIVAALRDDGIEIARRTVAKYRGLMRIPSSAQRRREMRAGLAMM